MKDSHFGSPQLFGFAFGSGPLYIGSCPQRTSQWCSTLNELCGGPANHVLKGFKSSVHIAPFLCSRGLSKCGWELTDGSRA